MPNKIKYQPKSIKEFLVQRVKVMAGAMLFGLFFSLVLMTEFWYITLITYIQLELFFWLGQQFFKSIEIKSTRFKTTIIIRLLLFYATVLCIALIFLIGVFFFQHYIEGQNPVSLIPSLTSLEMKNFFKMLLIGFAIGSVFFFYVQWSEALKNQEQLEKEKLIFQYETLKNQLDPHFLFNNLNTLSSLVKSDPDLSEDFIQKLASVYRYILDNHEKKLVSVTEELRFVEEYFFLRKIRDEEKIELHMNLTGLEDALILPVSVQLLVENALKHNLATRQNPLIITIKKENHNSLTVTNNLQKKMHLTDSSGIGLKNLNERCKLILNREIRIVQTNNEFMVTIPVAL